MADATLSVHETKFIVNGVEQDFRSDGRSCQDYRYFEVETGIVSNTSGSARLRLVSTSTYFLVQRYRRSLEQTRLIHLSVYSVQSKTDILIGVKAEIGEPHLDKPNQGRVEFFVDW